MAAPAVGLTPVEKKKFIGAVPYVFATSVAGEFLSDFIPLGQKAGFYLLDESSGKYYETAAGTGVNLNKTVLKFKANKEALVNVGKPPEKIDGLAPYTAITDVWANFDPADDAFLADPSTWDYTDNRAYDKNGKPLYWKGFDYKQYAADLKGWALPKAQVVWAAAKTLADKASPTAAEKKTIENNRENGFVDPATDAQKIEFWARTGGLFAEVVKGITTELTAPNHKNLIALAAGDDPTAQHPHKRIAQLGDYLTDKISLDSTGLPFVSLPAVEAKVASGRNPQRGPFDYLLTKDGKLGTEQLAVTATEPKDIVAALAAATTDAEKLRVVNVFIPASVQTELTYTGRVDRVALDKTPWVDAAGAVVKVTIGTTKISWGGAKWVLVP